MEQVITIFESHVEDMITATRDLITELNIDPYAAMSPDDLRKMVANPIRALQADLQNDTPTAFPNYWAALAQPRAEQGFAISGLLNVIQIGTDTLHAHMKQFLAGNHEALEWWSERLRIITHRGVNALAESFVNAHERIINEQASQIRALASPIVPVYTGVLVLPLVGEVDTRRASRIMESLLEEIVRSQADIVLIDVTGVPVVDTQVANYILQMARATRLLGAQVMLVGISAEIAQTMVQLGVELGDVVTRSNLQAGIEYALRLQGRAIQPLPVND